MRTSSSHHEDDTMRLLYEASYSGSVSALNSLIQQDPLILFKISQTSFSETPLHISALLSHLDFTKALLSHNPRFALELDSSRMTALHRASAEGHVDIVKELLKVHDQLCLWVDEEGRIPLHYAAMRGRTEVVRALIRAKPESMNIFENGKSVFHLCVTYNHLETLKALLEMDVEGTRQLLNLKDLDGGNTILHLAIMFKQIETTRYLLSIPKVRAAASMENKMGFTAHDIIQHIPKDMKSLEIQLMMMNANIQTQNSRSEPPPSTTTSVNLDEAVRPPKKIMKRTLKSMVNWLKHKDDNWLEETRGTLSLVATVISTITFQAVINPPGGVIQQSSGISSSSSNTTLPIGIISSSSSNSTQNSNDPLGCIITHYYVACPGEAMSAFQFQYLFLPYLICNSISFIASLSITLLLVSGVPLKNTAVMWILSIGMCVTVMSLGLTYIYAVLMVTPSHLWGSAQKIDFVSIRIWIGLLALVGLFITLRFLTWLLKKCIKKIKRQMSIPSRNQNECCSI